MFGFGKKTDEMLEDEKAYAERLAYLRGLDVERDADTLREMSKTFRSHLFETDRNSRLNRILETKIWIRLELDRLDIEDPAEAQRLRFVNEIDPKKDAQYLWTLYDLIGHFRISMRGLFGTAADSLLNNKIELLRLAGDPTAGMNLVIPPGGGGLVFGIIDEKLEDAGLLRPKLASR